MCEGGLEVHENQGVPVPMHCSQAVDTDAAKQYFGFSSVLIHHLVKPERKNKLNSTKSIDYCVKNLSQTFLSHALQGTR